MGKKTFNGLNGATATRYQPVYFDFWTQESFARSNSRPLFAWQHGVKGLVESFIPQQFKLKTFNDGVPFD